MERYKKRCSNIISSFLFHVPVYTSRPSMMLSVWQTEQTNLQQQSRDRKNADLSRTQKLKKSLTQSFSKFGKTIYFEYFLSCYLFSYSLAIEDWFLCYKSIITISIENHRDKYSFVKQKTVFCNKYFYMHTYFNIYHPFIARIFICNLIFHQITTIAQRRIITPINVLLLLFIFFMQ